MNFVMRFDVDKPYGNHTLVRRILSKFVEETNFPFHFWGYLDQVYFSIQILKKYQIKAIFYFRKCTIPDQELLQLLIDENHGIGFHAEDTQSELTFQAELRDFEKNIYPFRIHSFTKHGSGKLKLGKNHFPPYEPDKYRKWGDSLGIPFIFGNEILNSDFSNTKAEKTFFPQCFWLESTYRSSDFTTVSDLSKIHKDCIVPIISHPENLKSFTSPLVDLQNLFELSTNSGVLWLSPDEILKKVRH